MAVLFDWKWVEPPDARAQDVRNDPERAPWPSFIGSDLSSRYPHPRMAAELDEEVRFFWRSEFGERIGAFWRELIERIERFDPNSDRAVRDPESGYRETEDWFFAAADRLFDEKRARTKVKDCVFISHQRADAYRGERVACLADHRGADVWLDVHNPTLRWLNGAAVSPAARSLLIAATVEIGLLNSTHVIALHTQSSLASRWVPYEFARAKARGLTSTQAAGWFEAGQNPTTHGDYVQLAVMTRDEPSVFNWLPGQAHIALPPAHCSRHKTKKLV